MVSGDVLVALGLTALAGAATLLGALGAIHPRLRSDGALALALAFAAGAMVLVSLVEMLPSALVSLADMRGAVASALLVLGAALAGSGALVLLGRCVPHAHEEGASGMVTDDLALRRRVRRSGVLIALAIAAHNLPEGLATFLSAVSDPRAGLAVAVAIALHNIPEGIAVAAPVYGASGSRARAVAIAGVAGALAAGGGTMALSLVLLRVA